MPNMQQSVGERSLGELVAFVAVSEETSFTRAARRLDRDPTMLSRRVQALERRLGVRLLERTTRSVALTEAGRGYLHRAQAILRAMEEADREAADHATGEPRGHLRLALPGSFGRLWLTPAIAAFLKAHPGITIAAEFSNRFVDLVGEGFDLAVRLGALTDSRLVARKVCDRRRLLCASPRYLARAGTPQRPDDLASHPCLVFSDLPHADRWDLVDRAGRRRRITATGPLVSDDAEVMVAAAIAGLGICLATDWLVGPALGAGDLVQVLGDWEVADEGAIYVVTPSGAGRTGKTRAFSDWIARHLEARPWLPGP